jgi:hypothetical protein
MDDQRTDRKGGKLVARAFVWLAIAYLFPMGCLALYIGITKQLWDTILVGMCHVGFALLFYFGLMTKQFPK